MADITKNETIQDDAIDLLLSQVKDKEKVQAIVSSITAPIQTAENDVFEVRRRQKLDNAETDMLDKWGELVGVSRQGRSDSEYLIQIKAKIAINISKGTIDDVASVFNLLTGATYTEIFEHFPREVDIFTNIDLSPTEDLIEPPFSYFGSSSGEGYGVGYYATTIGIEVAYLYAIMDKVLSAGYRIGHIGYVPAEHAFSYFGSSSGEGYGDGGYATSL